MNIVLHVLPRWNVDHVLQRNFHSNRCASIVNSVHHQHGQREHKHQGCQGHTVHGQRRHDSDAHYTPNASIICQGQYAR